MGDVKTIDSNLYELRFFLEVDIGFILQKKDDTIIILLCGGDRSTQSKDIKKAKELLKEV